MSNAIARKIGNSRNKINNIYSEQQHDVAGGLLCEMDGYLYIGYRHNDIVH